MIKRLIFAAVLSLISMGSAFAACTNPLPITNGSGDTVNMSVSTNADGNCQYNVSAGLASAAVQPGAYQPGAISDISGITITTAHGCAIAGYGVGPCLGKIDDDINTLNTTATLSVPFKGQSSEPAAGTTGNPVAAFGDLTGKLVTSPYANRENMLRCAVTITGTGATTCTGMAAQGAGVKIYITSLCITRNDAGTTAATATLNDTATSLYDVPNNGGGGGICPPLPVPLAIAANTAFQVTMGASITSVHVSAQGFTGY